MHRQQTSALHLLERRLEGEGEKYPRTVIVKALVECFSELPETPGVLKRIALRDPSPGPGEPESAEFLVPAPRGLTRPGTTVAEGSRYDCRLRDRAQHDPNPWLQKWCHATLVRMEGPDKAPAGISTA